MERKINSSLYMTAFVISALLFIVGMLIGMSLAYNTTSQMRGELDRLRAASHTLELLTLIEANDTSFACNLYSESMEKFNLEASNYVLMLETLERQRGKYDAELMKLKAEDSEMQIRNFMLLQNMIRKCSLNKTPVLYFYSNENYNELTDQGIVIGRVRGEFPNLVFYSFDVNVDNAALKALKNAYNITGGPTLVIGDKKYEGFMDEGKLREIFRG